MSLDTRAFPAINKMQEGYWWRNTTNVLGFDVGKKGNPSHVSIFSVCDVKVSDDEVKEILIQIHQRFLDGWEYTRQVEYLNACVEWFNIQRGYADNTRGELEERNLSRKIIPITLGLRDGPTAKGKMKMATQFALLVEQDRIKLLDDDRFLSQILCVDNMLKAPDTPQGHADSFISVMLAVGVYSDFFASDRAKRATSIGNIQDMIDIDQKTLSSTMIGRKDSIREKCKICGNIKFDPLPDGLHKKCQKCLTRWSI